MNDKLSAQLKKLRGIYLVLSALDPKILEEMIIDAERLEKLVDELSGTLKEIVEIEALQPLRYKNEHKGSIPDLIKAYIYEREKEINECAGGNNRKNLRDKIALENPIGVISTKIRKPDQIIQPWQFGHGETKATCLWLKNLPLLQPTKIVDGREARVHRAPPSQDRWKNRSRTYQGIAQAMANQWGRD